MNETERVIQHLQNIETKLARVETKLDFHKEDLDEHHRRISGLERKFWTSIGAAVLSFGAYVKSMIE